MRFLYSFLALLYFSIPMVAEEKSTQESEPEIILPASPPQKIYTRYQTDFNYHHDRGLFFSAAIGPQWNHSINNPKAKAIRFGGRFSLGGYVANGFALFGSVWGDFLEAASIVAVGPGFAFLFDSTNISIETSIGIGKAFNLISSTDIKAFSETVLAAEAAIGKYWWISSNSSLGLTLTSGIHGLTVSQGDFNNVGWNIGLRLSYLFG